MNQEAKVHPLLKMEVSTRVSLAFLQIEPKWTLAHNPNYRINELDKLGKEGGVYDLIFYNPEFYSEHTSLSLDTFFEGMEAATGLNVAKAYAEYIVQSILK